MRIGPTTRLAVNAELHVGAAAESLVGTDTALVAGCDSLDTFGAADNGSKKSEFDADRAEGWTDGDVGWQHTKVSTGCTAGRTGSSYKDYDTLEARGGGKMAEVAV